MKSHQIVQLSTSDINNQEPVTTSLVIAKEFKKLHKNVLKDIRELENSLNEINIDGLKIEPIEYIDNANKKNIYYNINRDMFVLLVMGYTGKKALKFKVNFVNAFNLMEKELITKKTTRHLGVSIRRSLTDSIRDNVSDQGSFKKFAYGNYTGIVYKKVTGMKNKQLRERYNIPKGATIRDYFDLETLEKIQKLESKIANFIEMIEETDDKLVYAQVKKYLDKMDNIKST